MITFFNIYIIFQKIQSLFLQFIKFISNPNGNTFEVLNIKQKIIGVGLYFVIIDFIISVFLWFLTEIAVKLGLFNPLNSKDDSNFIIIEIIIIGIVLALIIEEFLFRYPLRFFSDKKYFRWIIYIPCIGFGLIHLSNYKIDSSHLLFAPLIVIIQIYGAFMFSFIRLKYGFWYGVLLHIIHNIWSLTWKYAIGFDL